MRALVVGRFQPVHKGHVALIARALEDCQQVVVGIGSAASKTSLRNPFTAAERRQLIAAAFPQEVASGRLTIVDVPDINNPPRWVEHVIGITGAIDRVFGNDDDTLALFDMANIPVASPGLMDRERCEASTIRVQLAEDDPAWRKAVPAAVAALLDQWGAGRRLRGLEAVA
ncbi:MAG: nicotinamide-nucleotide adenylyltransferase [Candidatus Thermoplasmatota archaeon]